MAAKRKVLVIGAGGREHALALRLLTSDSVREVLVCPGNAGTAVPPIWASRAGKILRNVTGDPFELSQKERIDLVVVGPEAPLVAGLVDQLAAAKIVAFGPSQAAAQLEGSKAFMKDFAMRHGLRTARYCKIEAAAALEKALADFSLPPVVKADGLCAGKGVVVSETHEEALLAAREMLSGNRFGSAGTTVVLEERLLGEEASVHAISDGERFIVLPAAQDHKRIGDGDTGPNTGGMGAYSPAPLVNPSLAERVRNEVIAPAIRGMSADGNPFRGVLFAGLMISPTGEPYLLEFNVRFGDPETQVLMSTLEGDLADVLDAAARGVLPPDADIIGRRHALCVVMAAHGYPGTPRLGDPIEGIAEAEGYDGVTVFHGGTRLSNGTCLTAGGRVLGVTGTGESLREAQERAYRAVSCIRFSGAQFRRDIGWRALGANSH